MKRALSLALVCLSLAACGGKDDKKTAAAIAKPPLQPVAGQGEGVVCPTLNASFVSRDEKDADTINFRTKVEDGRYSYSLSEDMPFQKADGKPVRFEGEKPSESAAMLATCDAESVTFIVQVDGADPIKMRFAPVGNDLKAEVATEGKSESVLYIRKN